MLASAGDPRPAVRFIGTVRTRHRDPRHTPVQAALNTDDRGTVELDARYVAALDGLQDFSHAWLVTWLGPLEEAAEPPPLRQVPFLLRGRPREVGILATRGPRRPSPLGLTLVRLTGVEGATIRFAGVDMVDGTPLVDLKPYVWRFDTPTGEVRGGWFDTVAVDDDITPARLQP